MTKEGHRNDQESRNKQDRDICCRRARGHHECQQKRDLNCVALHYIAYISSWSDRGENQDLLIKWSECIAFGICIFIWSK